MYVSQNFDFESDIVIKVGNAANLPGFIAKT